MGSVRPPNNTGGIQLDDYARQSRFSDPGKHAALLDDLPTELPELAAVVRNVIVHYRAAGITFTGDRLAEADNRWVERMLATDQSRFPEPLATSRPLQRRVAGCCRDFTLVTVAALRHRGIPARSRVIFAPYFTEGFHHDHVIVQVWQGGRWRWMDAELEPGPQWSFDPCDMPRGFFVTAAQAWLAFRRGEIDVDGFGVAPDLPIRGAWFVRNFVFLELAHRLGDEMLLWDEWGEMSETLDGDLNLVDDIARLLLDADDADGSAGSVGEAGGSDGAGGSGGEQAGGSGCGVSAESELARRYAEDPRLHPGETVRSFSPTGIAHETRV